MTNKRPPKGTMCASVWEANPRFRRNLAAAMVERRCWIVINAESSVTGHEYWVEGGTLNGEESRQQDETVRDRYA